MDFWTREDSQLGLPASAEIDPQNPPKPHPAVLARWAGPRGHSLGAFYVERNMNRAVEAFSLGPLHGRGDKSEVFGEGLLSALNFERRTKAALLVAPTPQLCRLARSAPFSIAIKSIVAWFVASFDPQ